MVTLAAGFAAGFFLVCWMTAAKLNRELVRQRDEAIQLMLDKSAELETTARLFDEIAGTLVDEQLQTRIVSLWSERHG